MLREVQRRQGHTVRCTKTAALRWQTHSPAWALLLGQVCLSSWKGPMIAALLSCRSQTGVFFSLATKVSRIAGHAENQSEAKFSRCHCPQRVRPRSRPVSVTWVNHARPGKLAARDGRNLVAARDVAPHWPRNQFLQVYFFPVPRRAHWPVTQQFALFIPERDGRRAVARMQKCTIWPTDAATAASSAPGQRVVCSSIRDRA